MLRAEAKHAVRVDRESFDVRKLAPIATILMCGGGEHVSLSDGQHRLRIDLASGTLLRGPINLRFLVDDDDRAPAQLRALTRFRALRKHGLFGRWLNRPERHAPRWILQLRVLDALSAGATERDMAIGLFGPAAVTETWREGGDAVRSAIRRLVRGARQNAAGGYRRLLR